jgi:O-antigen ligase
MRYADISPRPVPNVDRSRGPSVLPIIGVALACLMLAAAQFVVGPELFTSLLIGAVVIAIVAGRPSLGVAVLMTLLMVQYGSRRFERTGGGSIASLIPAGSGLLTVNNVLGLFLALLLVYQVYRYADWTFLRSRQVQIVLVISALLVLSGLFNRVDYEEQMNLGLRVTGQDPMRMLATRAAFLVFFVAFVRSPSELRLLVGLFVTLALITAYGGSSAAISGGSDVPQAATYRAGGLGTLIETAGNPNRLALISTLGLIFTWEHGQSRQRPGLVWLNNAAVVFLAVTVILTASRGGALGLTAASLMLFLRRRGFGRRMIYGAIVALVAGVLVYEVVPPAALERLSNIPGVTEDSETEGGGSLERRGYTYGIAFQIWSQSPLIGVGLGNWEFKRFTLDPLHSAAVPHNSLLLAVTEGGIIVAGLYLALFVLTLRRLGALERDPEVAERARSDGTFWIIRATRVALFAFLVFSMFGDLWELIFFYFLFGLAGALIARYSDFAPSPAHA